MARLEELKKDALVKGIKPDGLVTVIDVKWHGDSVVELTYKDAQGSLGSELIFRDKEPTLEIIESGQVWSFDADAKMMRLVSEAYRIRMAYLFDPHLAVHTSLLDPLPHQITAVYDELLGRQPLRFLLADDPGAHPAGAVRFCPALWIGDHRLSVKIQSRAGGCRCDCTDSGF